jgi:hypothetical protein
LALIRLAADERTAPMLHPWKLAALFALLPSPALLQAADCNSLRGLTLAETSITAAERIASGTFVEPVSGKTHSGLPPFCRVTGILRPSGDSEIRFEVWLPESGWNGRFLGVGNGGFAGLIGYDSLAGNLARGFATAASDTGHQADGVDATWAFGHPAKVKDFGWRAVHLTAERAKSIIEAYYGKPPAKSYFDSCSDGGREALMEAQRFPGDYDGILAGAPANAWTRLLSAGVAEAQDTMGDPHAYIPDLKLPAIQRAALAACDAADGVKDGIVGDPAKCHFDPEVLLCRRQDSLDCLTRPQIASLRALYRGGADSSGEVIFPGFTPGDEEGWSSWVIGPGPDGSSGSLFVRNYFRYMVTGDAKANILTLDRDTALSEATAKTAADLDATDPDLSRFAERGGKLIVYHGWNDPAISPWNTVDYYRAVEKQMGDARTASFLRLYMAPGVEHCTGGPGPSAFGQLGIPTARGPKYGLFDALTDWVEKGTPAGEVTATKYSPEHKVVMTRPLCPYPQVAQYRGSGDSNDAANFACANP